MRRFGANHDRAISSCGGHALLRRPGLQHLRQLDLSFAARACAPNPTSISRFYLRDGDALITRARANLVTLFLDDPAATHLLFVDADIGFTPEQVFRLIESGADVAAGIYPIKRVNWDKAKRMLEGNRPPVAAPSAALDYVLEINDPDNIVVDNGFTRVRYAGTGFLMIRRTCWRGCASIPLTHRCSSSASIPPMRWRAARTGSRCSRA